MTAFSEDFREERSEEERIGKQLYAYQHAAIESIFNRLQAKKEKYSILYQLPTGGGKTVIFSEIARKYIQSTGKKVLILTHRLELCAQTSAMLAEFGVNNKIINSEVKTLPQPNPFMCFVAMVETLNNRLNSAALSFEEVGLIIIDEAHYNSFRKLFKFFETGITLGVTATPLSSNIKLPMKDNYDELIVGESISSLIQMGFLAKATTFSYQVGLTSLKIGINGDYTVSSSEKLYSNVLMQQKLLMAYEERGLGKKTLIFNNGIQTSLQVYYTFKEAGYPVRHLDNTHSVKERRDILDWFKATPNAILTSVSILTTGFDEPTVECIILNRATRSLTLYFQMIGRGSRVLKNKNQFIVIDLGNNLHRFGLWENPLDWESIFRTPDLHLAAISSDEEIEKDFKYVLPSVLQQKFAKSTSIDFDIKGAHRKAVANGLRPKQALDDSIQHHLTMCLENSNDLEEALDLADILNQQIEYRVKQFAQCLSKSSDSYVRFLTEDYRRRLRLYISGFKPAEAIDAVLSTDEGGQ